MTLDLQDKLYTSTQVADILGVSLRTLYRYMEDGRIQSMRTASGRHRFTKDHITDFLNAGNFDPQDFGETDRQAPAQNFQQPQQQTQHQPSQFSQYSNDVYRQNRPQQQPQDQSFNESQSRYQAPSQFNNFNRDTQNVSQHLNNQEQTQSIPETPVYKPFGEYKFETPIKPNPTVQEFSPNKGATNFDNQQNPSRNIIEEADDVFFSPSSSNSFLRNQSYRNDSFAPEKVENKFEAPNNDMYSGNQKMNSEFENNIQPKVQNPIQEENSYEDPFKNQYTQKSTRDENDSYRNPFVEKEEVKEVVTSKLSVRYYRSDINDLLELARKIKDTGKSRDLEYAFTLYAGLSLHYFIKPFTVLHFYGNPEDMQIWREELRLNPVTNKEDANIGILINTDIIFIPNKDIAGFRVVEDKLLLRDLTESKEDELVKQFRQRLMTN